MSADSTTQCLLFPGIFRKPVVAQFDQREGSSDGGALLLKAADGHYRLVEELTACLQDQRQGGKVDHTLRDLVAQRVFAIACGSGLSNNVGGVKLFLSVLSVHSEERAISLCWDCSAHPTKARS